jgi:uncharacterized protein YjbJ (UPF0337 family)
MNTSEVKESWKEQKDKLKQRIADLTDNDLLSAENTKKEMFDILQKKLGKTKKEIQRILARL